MIEEDKIKKASSIFKALASDIRIRMLLMVFETKKPLHIKGIARNLKLDYATTYRHVQTLKKAGLVDIFEVGRSRVLSIKKPEELNTLMQFVINKF